MEIGRVACEGNPEEGDKRERGKCERKEQLILDIRFFVTSRTLSILRRGRCAAVSHPLIFLTATQRPQRSEAFAFAISRPSSFCAVDAVPP